MWQMLAITMEELSANSKERLTDALLPGRPSISQSSFSGRIASAREAMGDEIAACSEAKDNASVATESKNSETFERARDNGFLKGDSHVWPDNGLCCTQPNLDDVNGDQNAAETAIDFSRRKDVQDPPTVNRRESGQTENIEKGEAIKDCPPTSNSNDTKHRDEQPFVNSAHIRTSYGDVPQQTPSSSGVVDSIQNIIHILQRERRERKAELAAVERRLCRELAASRDEMFGFLGELHAASDKQQTCLEQILKFIVPSTAQINTVGDNATFGTEKSCENPLMRQCCANSAANVTCRNAGIVTTQQDWDSNANAAAPMKVQSEPHAVSAPLSDRVSAHSGLDEATPRHVTNLPPQDSSQEAHLQAINNSTRGPFPVQGGNQGDLSIHYESCVEKTTDDGIRFDPRGMDRDELRPGPLALAESVRVSWNQWLGAASRLRSDGGSGGGGPTQLLGTLGQQGTLGEPGQQVTSTKEGEMQPEQSRLQAASLRPALQFDPAQNSRAVGGSAQPPEVPSSPSIGGTPGPGPGMLKTITAGWVGISGGWSLLHEPSWNGAPVAARPSPESKPNRDPRAPAAPVSPLTAPGVAAWQRDSAFGTPAAAFGSPRVNLKAAGDSPGRALWLSARPEHRLPADARGGATGTVTNGPGRGRAGRERHGAGAVGAALGGRRSTLPGPARVDAGPAAPGHGAGR